MMIATSVESADYGDPIKPLGITGNDDRYLVERVVPPWSAIGRVNRRIGGFCTGSLIAPQKVLTAAHCLWNPRTRNWLPPVSLHFVTGYSKGEFIAHARITKFRVSQNYRPGRSVRDYLPFDWAILTLDKNIADLVGIIPLNKIDADKEIAQAGYSKDKPHILTLNKRCSIVRQQVQQGILFHNCDATQGDSGSPILQYDNNQIRIIGIHVSTMGRGEKALGIAVLNSSKKDWR